MPVPIVLSGAIASWPVICAIYGGGAVVVIVLVLVIAKLTRGSHPKLRHRTQLRPRSAAAEAPSKEHVTV